MHGRFRARCWGSRDEQDVHPVHKNPSVWKEYFTLVERIRRPHKRESHQMNREEIF